MSNETTFQDMEAKNLLFKLIKQEIPDIPELTPHVHIIKSEQGPFKCLICGAKFVHHSTLETHLKVHELTKPSICNVCEVVFTHLYDLEKHSKEHATCRACGLNFSNTSFYRINIFVNTSLYATRVDYHL